MSYEFYKLLHLLCILGLCCGLGGMAILALLGGAEGEHKQLRKVLMIVHGVALLVIFVAGFGMMARKGIGIGASNTGWPPWIFGKFGIWMAFGALAAFVKRKAGLATHIFWIVPLLGAIAAYLAIMHPGAPGG
ncbi:MAG: hypothetical protein JKY37_03140 [Nannocystaceae bacterium]|nr:hypothetical protein [Nannocystaceae bacterium]